MSDNDVYLLLVDEVWCEIEEQKPKSKDEVMEIADRISNKIFDKIDSAMQDIQDDYCDEKGLVWEEDE